MSITLFLADDPAETDDWLWTLLDGQPDMQIVGTARNGRDTLEKIERHCPDVVILGTSTCQCSGAVIARNIHRQQPHTHLIFLTDRPVVSHITEALQAGCDAVLLWDCVEEELVRAVHTVYANGRYLSRQVSNLLIEEYVQHRPATSHIGSRLTRLSQREREVLQLVVEGKSSISIADKLTISPKTVETYRSRLMQKLNINNLPTLVRFAIRNDLIHLE